MAERVGGFVLTDDKTIVHFTSLCREGNLMEVTGRVNRRFLEIIE